jgi:hypothetical protein
MKTTPQNPLHSPAQRTAEIIEDVKNKLRMLGTGNMSAVVPMEHTINNSGGVFYALTQGKSYRTQVAMLVWNDYAKVPELWIDSFMYSSSTARHKALFRTAYAGYCKPYYDSNAPQREPIEPRVYTFELSQNYIPNRTYSVNYTKVEREVAEFMRHAVKPKLHDATRTMAVRHAITALDYAVHLMSHEVPDPVAYEDNSVPMDRIIRVAKIKQYSDMSEFYQTLVAMPMREMRACISGIVDLEKN